MVRTIAGASGYQCGGQYYPLVRGRRAEPLTPGDVAAALGLDTAGRGLTTPRQQPVPPLAIAVRGRSRGHRVAWGIRR